MVISPSPVTLQVLISSDSGIATPLYLEGSGLSVLLPRSCRPLGVKIECSLTQSTSEMETCINSPQISSAFCGPQPMDSVSRKVWSEFLAGSWLMMPDLTLEPWKCAVCRIQAILSCDHCVKICHMQFSVRALSFCAGRALATACCQRSYRSSTPYHKPANK